jgi:hypothetical protein
MKRWALGQYLLRYHTNLLLLSPPERYNKSKKGNAKNSDFFKCENDFYLFKSNLKSRDSFWTESIWIKNKSYVQGVYGVDERGFIVSNPISLTISQRKSSAATKTQPFSEIKLNVPNCRASSALTLLVFP